MGFERESAPEGAAFEPASDNAFRRVIVTASDTQVGAALPRGMLGAGVVHHVAFRVPDDATQQEWREKLEGLGYHVSPVMDRTYFHSIYYREPGGVLFELATDPPGFTVDESPAELGTALKLPPQYEKHRATLEEALPQLRVPTG
jgi:glyoxalase family protein